jgi:phosphatidylglycerol:prolipoprotein diacylglycerol transferase
MLWIALVVGTWRTYRAARRTDIKPDYVIDVALYGVLAGVLFAHLASIVLDLPYYLQNPREILGIWSSLLSSEGGLRGLSFHGGVIGGVGAVYLFARKKKINFLALADLLSPGLAIAYAIARIGCFLNGCCYGVPTTLPWGVRFCEDGVWTPPSHPTQIYASLANVAIFGLLVMLEKRRRFTGQIFLSYLAMYSIYRFLNEFLRKGVTAEVWFWNLTQAQIVSLAILIVSATILWLKLRKKPIETGK